MDLTEKEIAILRKMVTGDEISLLSRIANNLHHQWSESPLPKETEWEFIHESIKREERKQALSLFISTIEKLAQHGS